MNSIHLKFTLAMVALILGFSIPATWKVWAQDSSYSDSTDSSGSAVDNTSSGSDILSSSSADNSPTSSSPPSASDTTGSTSLSSSSSSSTTDWGNGWGTPSLLPIKCYQDQLQGGAIPTVNVPPPATSQTSTISWCVDLLTSESSTTYWSAEGKLIGQTPPVATKCAAGEICGYLGKCKAMNSGGTFFLLTGNGSADVTSTLSCDYITGSTQELVQAPAANQDPNSIEPLTDESIEFQGEQAVKGTILAGLQLVDSNKNIWAGMRRNVLSPTIRKNPIDGSWGYQIFDNLMQTGQPNQDTLVAAGPIPSMPYIYAETRERLRSESLGDRDYTNNFDMTLKYKAGRASKLSDEIVTLYHGTACFHESYGQQACPNGNGKVFSYHADWNCDDPANGSTYHMNTTGSFDIHDGSGCL